MSDETQDIAPDGHMHSGAWTSPRLTPEGSRLQLKATFDALEAVDETLRVQIAELLGRSWPPPERRSMPSESPKMPLGEPAPRPPERPRNIAPPIPEPEVAPMPPTLSLNSGGLVSRGPAPHLPLRDPAAALPAPQSGGGLNFEPLLSPGESRAILSTALSTASREGAPDVPLLLQTLLTGRPLRDIPLELRWSLRRGVQVLLDTSEALVALHQDRQVLLESLADVVGESLEVLRFRDFPERAGKGAMHAWTAYQLPPPHTPVLVVSALGVYGKRKKTQGIDASLETSLERWLELAELLSRQGSPLLVLTPTPQDYYPQVVQSRLELLEWECTTHARDARQLQRRREFYGR